MTMVNEETLDFKSQFIDVIQLCYIEGKTMSYDRIGMMIKTIHELQGPLKLLILRELHLEIIEYIPEVALDDIAEFVFFAEASIKILKEMDESPIPLREFSKAYTNDISSDKLKNETEHRADINLYDSIWRLFNDMNYRNIHNFEMRKLAEHQLLKSPDKKMAKQLLKKRSEGIEFLPSQLHELKTFAELKLGLIGDESMLLTYKRFITEKGKVKKISFEDLKNLTKFLRDRIESDSEVQHKNIYYYKLEHNMGFETLKTIMNAIEHNMNDCSLTEKKEAINDLLSVLQIPMLNFRKSYIHSYFKDDSPNKSRWKNGIPLITLSILINIELKKMTNVMVDTRPDSKDMKKYKKIYNVDSLDTKYEMKTKFAEYREKNNFSQKTYKLVMEQVQELKNYNFKQIEKQRKYLRGK